MEATIADTKEGDIDETTSSKKDVVNAFITQTPAPPKEGDIVEGVVLAKEGMFVFVDLGIFSTGVIYGREYLNAKDIIKKTKIGDVIQAKVTLSENDDGYIELSLREAKQAAVWAEAEQAIKSKETFELIIKDANKGGLMLEWGGLMGFLPASQLKPEHYPRVEGGDKDKIEVELKKLIGEKIKVSVITADPDDEKLIFSEKSSSPEKEKIISKYSIGDVIEGEVTGAVDFGVFVKIEDGLEGLIHISEMDWALVEDPKTVFKVGDVIRAKIIEIKENKISLSIKALKENPWKNVENNYKKGDKVDVVVIKFNKYGALVSIEEGVAGLIHVSEFGTIEKLSSALELGKAYTFEISLFEPKEHRMTLILPSS